MQFGGSSRFGVGQFGGDPYGTTPGYVISEIIRSLSRFKKSGSTGFLNTLARLTGPLDDESVMDLLLHAGTPAMLVAYNQWSHQQGRADGSTFTELHRYAVVCLSSDFGERINRLEGDRTVYDPGLDNMEKWAKFYTMKAFEGLKSCRQVTPTGARYLSFKPERFMSVIEFTCVMTQDYYDDAITNTLERIGLCHTPTDLTKLFLDDTTTPHTDDPTSINSGVAELTS